ncbi:hypothetical protein I6I18_09845 [Kytococcus sedentarius]|uniref:Uncharacterized protein n=1 Tax=Kytococcus sedentarius (strain ATCC 14392 / DSM 20547 / JCM 11482 / CCUG 33030 / NBRC 15357 / NCTC 11040 / CCM 314 / 541) TaxID=478801 RepID=C7NFN6_KYTSD|nr:hypothetical protein [Kytococcus sedentarius]ACV07394.1 hypothetical protein Ksed_24290 [Kytococcus sedentarius DSM 20547]QQB63350.1 hypothetical protein I6I18_09845 [Kytococcus sedentarius]STX13756.1 Uncharacterised protein [Kytococcus sedentarius]
MRRSLTVTSLLSLSLVLAACGGEGDSDESTSPNDSPSTSASSPAETDDSDDASEPADSDDDASETDDDASETAEPTPSGDADGATAPFAGALLAEGEEAEESLKGTVQGAPQWMTFTDDGVNSAELAARCTGKGKLTLQPLAKDLESARPGKPQLLPCDGERHDVTLQGAKPFSSVLIVATSQPTTFEVAAIEND